MKQILDYFMIDGEVGGNQDWFRNVVMHIGGCAAATACDCCIYFAKYKGKKNLYPFDAENLSKDRKSTRLNSSHLEQSRMPSSA